MGSERFLRRPVAPLLGLPLFKESKVAVLGIPYDSSQTFETGSRFFPIFVRIASDSIEEFSLIFEADVRRVDASDWGDVIVSFGNFEETKRRVHSVLKDIPAERLAFIGGDHSITIATVSFLRERIRHYVHLDAHADFEEEYLGFRYGHDSTLRRVGEILGWERIHLIGLRSASEKALRDLRAFGVDFLRADEVADDFTSALEVLKKADYISLDMDFFDPAFAPEVGNPEPMGISPRELVRTIKFWRARFFDIVEGIPRSPNSPTAVLAASILREVIIQMARQ